MEYFSYGKRLLALVLILSTLGWGQAQKNLTIVVHGTQVSLAWGASTTQGVTYAIYRSNISGSGYVKVGTASGLAYTDTIAPGTYYYVVRAALGAKESANSNEVSATL